MKKCFILTSVLALTACGGGNGGGGVGGSVTPGAIVTPDATVRAPITVDSDSGLSMIDINATRSDIVNQAIMLAESIENDNSGVDYNASVRSASRQRMTTAKSKVSNISQQDIDSAYETMYDIFVNHNYTGYTNHDVLVSLALIYMDKDKILELLGQENNKVDEKIDNLIDGLSDNDDFSKDAQDIYQDFGKNFELTLENARFYHNSNDTNWYKFVFDENGKITHLQEQDGHKYAKDKNGVFSNDIVGKRYYFEHTGIANNHKQEVDVDIEYNTADIPSNESDIRNALIAQVSQQYGLPDMELNDIASWINSAPIIEFGTKCTNANGCIELGNVNYKEEIRIETAGKDLGLKYSDFGLRHEKNYIREGDSELVGLGLDYYEYTEHGGFVGGYEDKQATPKSEMVFKGNSYVGLTRKLSDKQIDEIMKRRENGEDIAFPYPENNYYTGTATLTVNGENNNLTQKLVADFSKNGWYEVTVDNMPVNGHGGTFAFDAKDNQIDEKWQARPDTHDGKMENLNIKYYGPEPDNATEAAGFVQYIEDKKGSSDWTFKADITFGGKKNN